MKLPLISHPTRGEYTETYTDDQLTDEGDLKLAAHNRVVAERGLRLFGADAGEKATYLESTAALHDFGKATPQFQAHVRPGEEPDCPDEEIAHARLGALATWYVLGELDAPDRDRLACTLAVARHHQAIPNTAQYTAETLARAFERTDGAIEAQLDAIENRWPGAAELLLEQAGLENPDWATFHAWATSREIVSQLREHCSEQVLASRTLRPDMLPERLYDRTLRYWSAITLADKSHAMDIPDEWVFDLETLGRDTIERYISDIRTEPVGSALESRLNDERERARRQTVRGIHEWLVEPEVSPNIATLTLPTGLGKTFTGLSAAFEARDILNTNCPHEASVRQIVYALPYTSIIEQTRAIFEDSDLWGADPQRAALTVHHYLSETVVHHGQYDPSDSTDSDNAESAELLGEAWRSGTVLTTFVQLFESLTGPTNRQGLKLPALSGSVIVLDEPQALPKDWWDGIERLLNLLVDEYDARVIAMTATQPSLVRNLDTQSLLTAGSAHEEEGCSHCSDGPSYRERLQPAPKSSYFEASRRVRYTINQTALSRQQGVDERHIGYNEAADRILDVTGADSSTLAICNTISSSKELTAVLRDRSTVTHLGAYIENVLEEYDLNAVEPELSIAEIADRVLDRFETEISDSRERRSVAILTLNSRYRPFDREILIELADRLSTKAIPFVLVSTQAIEAGVDLSFRTVFRDLAPLDSIVQAAGRCNRSYEWGEHGGHVIVWLLAAPDEDIPADPAENPPAYYVYEKGATDAGIPGHLRLISSVLAELPDYEKAPDVSVSRDAVTDYFEALEEKSLWNADLREAIDHAQGRWLGRQSLIGGVPTLDVLVGKTNADMREVEAISDQLSVDNPEGYDRLENSASLRVSIPKSLVEETPQLTRIDKRERNSDGVQVFEFLGGAGLEYDLSAGGLAPTDDSISNRFTI